MLEPQIFNIEYYVVSNNTYEKILEMVEGCCPQDVLPRLGDTLNIDGGLFVVIGVEYSYKDQFNPSVYLKRIGDFEQFLQNLYRG